MVPVDPQEVRLVEFAYAEAYEISPDLGGGFRGAALNKFTRETFRSEVLGTLAEAQNDADRAVHAWAGKHRMAVGEYGTQGLDWRADFFIWSYELTR